MFLLISSFFIKFMFGRYFTYEFSFYSKVQALTNVQVLLFVEILHIVFLSCDQNCPVYFFSGFTALFLRENKKHTLKYMLYQLLKCNHKIPYG